MTWLIRLAALALFCTALDAAAPAAEEAYPGRPIRLVVSFPPGGSADLVARALQPQLERQRGQPLIVDNRPVAAGVIGIDVVAKATADLPGSFAPRSPNGPRS